MKATRFLVVLGISAMSTICFAANDRKSSGSSESETRSQQAAIVLPLDASKDVCYTMRMYKVKATEHLKENESARRGYTTCQLARDYQIRSADIRVEGAVRPTLPRSKLILASCSSPKLFRCSQRSKFWGRSGAGRRSCCVHPTKNHSGSRQSQ